MEGWVVVSAACITRMLQTWAMLVLSSTLSQFCVQTKTYPP